MNISDAIQIEMITADLQQCLDLLPPKKFELAFHHLEEARAKIQHMKDSAPLPPLPSVQQTTLQIE